LNLQPQKVIAAKPNDRRFPPSLHHIQALTTMLFDISLPCHMPFQIGLSILLQTSNIRFIHPTIVAFLQQLCRANALPPH
jgi:hypothetical protein